MTDERARQREQQTEQIYRAIGRYVVDHATPGWSPTGIAPAFVLHLDPYRVLPGQLLRVRSGSTTRCA